VERWGHDGKCTVSVRRRDERLEVYLVCLNFGFCIGRTALWRDFNNTGRAALWEKSV
jgi:hypothetical protein